MQRVCNRAGFFKLTNMDGEKRGRLAKMISHLDIGDDPSCGRGGIMGINASPPQDGIYLTHIPMPPVSPFVHPRLRSLTALAFWGMNSAIDDVFPALRQASCLEVLQITHHVERNTPDAFPRLMKCLPRRRVFWAYHVGCETLLPHLAALPAIQDISLDGRLDSQLVHQALTIPGAFNKLEALDIAICVDATPSLLPHLPHLKTLCIALDGDEEADDDDMLSYEEYTDATKSSLQEIGAISSLAMLKLKFAYFDLPNEIQLLKQLSSLRKLVFKPFTYEDDDEDDDDLNFSDAKALNSLGRACPHLRHLHVGRCHVLDGLDTCSPTFFPGLKQFHTSAVRLRALRER